LHAPQGCVEHSDLFHDGTHLLQIVAVDIGCPALVLALGSIVEKLPQCDKRHLVLL
jgi:hypothetical protein